MSYDGIMTAAVSEELNTRFAGGKIDKIYQPEKDVLLFNLRAGKDRGSLLLSAAANNPYAYITKKKFKNPQTPPAFCMLLRKHLESSTILSITQIEMDRILAIKVRGIDELFDPVEKTLMIEMMGRHSNIILLNENGDVIDAIKRIGIHISRVRQVLPGEPYSLENIIDRDNPLTEDAMGFAEKWAREEAMSAKNFLIRNYLGISPLIAREICYRAGTSEKVPVKNVDPDAFKRAFFSVVSEVKSKDFSPQSVSDGTKVLAYSVVNLTQYPEERKTFYESPSELLDTTFTDRVEEDRVRQKSQNLNRQIKNHLERALHKQEKMEFELRDAKDRKKYKVYADVLSSNAWQVERGLQEVELENFYDNMAPLRIPLDPTKDAIQNAARYYKRYAKLKHAEAALTARIERNRSTIRYLDSMLYNLEDAENVEEVDGIQEEFREDFLKKKYKGHRDKKKKAAKQPGYLRFRTGDGKDVYVGRNNRQNQELTLKFAAKSDLWFHVKSGPGSHVILRDPGENPSPETITECAMLAAYYSRSRHSANVEVDYTRRAHIRRHPSNQPGLVLYTDFSSVRVTPNKKSVEALRMPASDA